MAHSAPVKSISLPLHLYFSAPVTSISLSAPLPIVLSSPLDLDQHHSGNLLLIKSCTGKQSKAGYWEKTLITTQLMTFLEFLKIAKWIWKLDLTVSGAEPERSPQRVENSWEDRQQSLLKVTHVVQSLSPIYSAPFVWKLQLKLLSEWKAKWRKCWACWNCENKRELWGVLLWKKMYCMYLPQLIS